jgi:hypothetical protein
MAASPSMASTSNPNTHHDTTASSPSQLNLKSTPTPNSVPLTLPEPPTSPATTLDVSGDGTTVKLDHLGPVVVNQDGTLSRIGNWDQMADIEKKNTLRILGKRNASRLAALKKEGEEETT